MCPQHHDFGFDPTGYVEYCRVKERHVRLGALKLPPQVTFEEGCVIEPVSCILRALKDEGRINVTDIMDEKLGRAEEAEG